MATADDDNPHDIRASVNAFARAILFFVTFVVCGCLWIAIDGNDMINDIILEAREAPAGNAAFGPIRDGIITLISPFNPRLTTAEHAGVLEWASGCYQVEAKWLVPFEQPSDDFLRILKSSHLLYGWNYSEGWLGAYHDYQYTSDDDRIKVLITYEKTGWNYSSSPAGYKVWLSYLSPSQTDCHP